MTLLEAANGLARQGEYAKAQSIVSTAHQLFPDEVNVIHVSGVVTMLCGNLPQALEYFHRALTILPNFHYSEHEIGNVHYAAGNKPEALRWYRKASDSAPTYGPTAMRAAMVARELGDQFGALELLRRAHKADPENPELVEMLAYSLIHHNLRPEAVRAYETLVLTPRARDQDHVRYMSLLAETSQFKSIVEHRQRFSPAPGSAPRYHADLIAAQARLAASFQRDAVIGAATAREASSAWCSADELIRLIKAAIATRRPFSLVRFGDGEGRFLACTDTALRHVLSNEETSVIADSIWTNWFAAPFDNADRYDIVRLHAAVVRSMETADVIGISTAARLAKDGGHFGYLAYLDGLVADLLRDDARRSATDALVVYRLHERSPFYRDLLSGLDQLSVVSPHPALAQRLGHHFGIAKVTSYVVPGEMRLPADARGHGEIKHFPARYRQLSNELVVPTPGAVFLVAAGLLGKVYCSLIRERGGIAIDMGAVADAWMGFLGTRPGQYSNPETWVLPDVGAVT